MLWKLSASRSNGLFTLHVQNSIYSVYMTHKRVVDGTTSKMLLWVADLSASKSMAVGELVGGIYFKEKQLLNKN